MTPKTYRRISISVEAMQMPVDNDIKAVEEIVEWLQPGLVTLYHSENDEDWDNAPVANPVVEWGVNYITLFGNGREYDARLGQWVTWDGKVALVVNDSMFREMFEEA